MSNAWLHIRFGLYHLQIGERRVFDIRWSRNDYHINNPVRFKIYTLRSPWS